MRPQVSISPRRGPSSQAATLPTRLVHGVSGLLLIVSMAVSLPCAAQSGGAHGQAPFVPGMLIVKFARGANVNPVAQGGGVSMGVASLDQLARRYGFKDCTAIFSPAPTNETRKQIYDRYGLSRIYLFTTDPQADVPAMAAAFESDPAVEYAEPDYVGHAHGIPNDTNFSVQWGLYNTGLNPPQHPGRAHADVHATDAWNWYTPEHVITVAILDTGLDLDHPDFWWPGGQSVIWTNVPECSGIQGIDDDGNGYVDDCHGFDFVNGHKVGNTWFNDADGPEDDQGGPHDGHGTVNSGIAGAITGNNLGVASLLGGGYNIQQIMPVKVIDQNNRFAYDKLEAGIYYAVRNNASVINMSLGGLGDDQSLHNAVDFAWNQGCVLVASMGNCNSNVPQYPAAYTNTIAVGATDTDDSRCVPPDWDFMGYDDICGSVHGSNYGSHIDVVAPGNWIYSTTRDGSYDYWAGTSMAAPFVSGLAALIRAKSWPEPPPNAVRQVIQSTADDQVGPPNEDTPGWDQYYGWGRINAARALGVPTPVYAEDFNTNINDWTVRTRAGTFATTTDKWVSPGQGLHMLSMDPGGGYAYGLSPNPPINISQDFTVATYFLLPQTNNHWFWVLSDGWIEIVIDYGNQLCAYQANHGPTLHLADLDTNHWHYIKAIAHPSASNYDIWLDGYYVTTAQFAGNYANSTRLGDFEDGTANWGEGYWDDLMVYGTYAPAGVPDTRETYLSATQPLAARNLPNPFRDGTRIEYRSADHAADGEVRLGIYDAGGRLVRTLIDSPASPASGSAWWDGRDAAGRTVSSGIYFFRVNVGDRRVTRPMVLAR